MEETRVFDFEDTCPRCGAQLEGLCAGGQAACLQSLWGRNDSQVSGCVGPNDRSQDEWLVDLGGTLRFDYAARPSPQASLPRYIPVIERQRCGLQLPPWPAYALHLHSVLTTKRLDITGCASDLRAYFRTGAGTRFVLLAYGQDTLMAELWARRYADRLVEKIATCGFDLVVAPNFSVYADQPRWTHLVRLRMSHVFYRMLAEADVAVVPHVYFGANEDLRRWGEWLAANPAVTTVACNLQTVRDASFFAKAVTGLSRLSDLAGRAIRLIISGPSTEDRLEHLFGALGPDVVVTNALPHQLAAHRHTLDGEGHRAFSPGPYGQLVVASIRAMADCVDRAVQRSARGISPVAAL